MPKRETIHGFEVIERASYAATSGLRAVPKTAAHARGYIYEGRKPIELGGKTFKTGDFVPRRRAEEYTALRGVSFEKRASERFEQSGARTSMSRYNWALDKYLDVHPGMTRGEARTFMSRDRVMEKLRRRPDADFYSHLWNPHFLRKPSKRAIADYVDALIDLGLIDEDDRSYYEEIFGG